MSDEDKGIVLHALAFAHWDDENVSGMTDREKGSLAIQAFTRILSERDSLLEAQQQTDEQLEKVEAERDSLRRALEQIAERIHPETFIARIAREAFVSP